MNKKNYIVLFLLIIAGFASVIWFFQSRDSKVQIRNVLLISMDTTRADHLSCYGYNRKTTPNVDTLAAEGIRCEKVITTAPLTLPAHSSIMTGTNPPYHGVHDNLDYQLSEDNITLAEILKKQGFLTGAVISSFVLDSQFNLDQGFDTYNDHFQEKNKVSEFSERKGDETTRIALDWIQKHKEEKFFYFLHYFDPHDSYAPPQPFSKEYSDDLYAGEIAFTDYCIGKVIAKLKSLDIYDSTLIIIVGDHGEMLGEHGEKVHSYFIYQGAIKVPLIFKIPGKRKAKTIESNVGIIDILPTVCSLLGIKPPDNLAGTDLSPFFNNTGQPSANRGLYCESLYPTIYKANSLLGIVEGKYKYIQTTRPELYDLEKDPRENINLVGAQPQRARILQDKLSQILKKQVRKSDSDSRTTLDAEAIRRLESLGYASGGITEDFSFDTSKDDPKDVLAFHLRYFDDVSDLIAQEKYEQAEKVLKELATQRRDFSGTYVKLGEVATLKKDFASVVSYLEEALRIRPDRFNVHNDLALALVNLDRMDEAVEHFQKALSLRPNYHMILQNLARISLERDQVDKSIEYTRKAIELDPDDADSYYDLGQALAKKNDLEGAIASYRKSLEIEPDRTSVLNFLGAALFKIKDYNNAIKEWNNSLKVKPAQPDIHDSIALAFMKMGKVDDAIDSYLQSLKINSGQPLINVIIADIYYKQDNFAEAANYYKAALKLKQDIPSAHNNLADISMKLGDSAEAIEHWKHSLEMDPNQIVVLNNIAWMSAVYKKAGFHNPDEAVRLAQRACELTDYKAPELLETLSAAYAAAGKFDKAVETIEKAAGLADAAGKKELANNIREHLKLFKASKAYYEDM